MKLIASLVEGADYASTASSLPFSYAVVFEDDAVVVGPIGVNGCMLANTADQEVLVGGSACIFRVPGAGARHSVNAGQELRVEVDVLSDPDDLGVLVPGNYLLHAEVTVYLQEQGGNTRPHSLKASLELILS